MDDAIFSIAIDEFDNKWFGAVYVVYELIGGTVYDVKSNPNWSFGNQYRASFDFTSLIPRDTYILTVQGAVGTDGIEIAPFSNYTFTVDYAGEISDTSPPKAPLAEVCAGPDLHSLFGTWYAQDTESAINLYSYAIGTKSGLTDVMNWTNTTETTFSRTDMNLIAEQEYFLSVKARNTSGLWSSIALPQGVFAGSGTCSSAYVYLPTILK